MSVPAEVAAELAAEVAATQAGVSRPVVIVDGGSGSGKSTIARPLAELLDAQLVRLDDIYPGWDGLEAGSAAVVRDVLGENPGWRRWDWEAERPAEWHPLDPERALVIEGSGALTRASRAQATYAVWLELGAIERRRRAIERDGDRYEPFWDRWAAQEAAFLARERPDLLADRVIDASRIAI
ncbi:MAG: ATP-binding protein [Schumannella sp.]